MGITIDNTLIQEVTTGLDDRRRLSTTLTLKSLRGCTSWRFIFENPADVQRLTQLMRYVGVSHVESLECRVIRTVSNSKGMIKGFGHSIFDKFFPVSTKDFMELTENQLRKMLVN